MSVPAIVGIFSALSLKTRSYRIERARKMRSLFILPACLIISLISTKNALAAQTPLSIWVPQDGVVEVALPNAALDGFSKLSADSAADKCKAAALSKRPTPNSRIVAIKLTKVDGQSCETFGGTQLWCVWTCAAEILVQ
jgi:hypothetical protein